MSTDYERALHAEILAIRRVVRYLSDRYGPKSDMLDLVEEVESLHARVLAAYPAAKAESSARPDADDARQLAPAVERDLPEKE